MKPPPQPPHWLKVITSGQLLWEYPSGEKKIYLTFDDGPHPQVTPRVLQLLKSHHAQASFFLLGENVSRHPELVQEIESAGHTLGNHSWSHPDGWKTPAGEYLLDVDRCAGVVTSLLFRPPYGHISLPQWLSLRRRGYRVVMWSVLTGDYDPSADGSLLLKHCIKNIGAGSIVVLHDSPKASSHCLMLLEEILMHFSLLGFSFDCLPCPGVRKIN